MGFMNGRNSLVATNLTRSLRLLDALQLENNNNNVDDDVDVDVDVDDDDDDDDDDNDNENLPAHFPWNNVYILRRFS